MVSNSREADVTIAASKAPASAAWFPAALVVALFFFWGVANHLNDVLIPQFKRAFTLTDFQSGLVQSAFYLGYFMFAIPASLFMKRFGYKLAVVLGLVLFGAGALLFVPAAEAQLYAFFLFALFVIACGLAFLETSANPLMATLGSPETSERRLNFAQAFNPLGAITGVWIGSVFILGGSEPSASASESALRAAQAQSVQGPYLVLGLIVLAWATLVWLTRFPPIANAPDEISGKQRGFADFRALFGRPGFLFGVFAQFCYVGAQAGVFSYMIRYAQHALPGMREEAASAYLFASVVGFMIGRFVGTALMWRFAPWLIMTAFALTSVTLMFTAFLVGGEIGLYAMVASPFFMSIMFPTIFALSIKPLGELTKAGASFLIMAIIGGAIFPALMGQISDVSAINVAMLAPLGCFAVIACFGFVHMRSGGR